MFHEAYAWTHYYAILILICYERIKLKNELKTKKCTDALQCSNNVFHFLRITLLSTAAVAGPLSGFLI